MVEHTNSLDIILTSQGRRILYLHFNTIHCLGSFTLLKKYQKKANQHSHFLLVPKYLVLHALQIRNGIFSLHLTQVNLTQHRSRLHFLTIISLLVFVLMFKCGSSRVLNATVQSLSWPSTKLLLKECEEWTFVWLQTMFSKPSLGQWRSEFHTTSYGWPHLPLAKNEHKRVKTLG